MYEHEFVHRHKQALFVKLIYCYESVERGRQLKLRGEPGRARRSQPKVSLRKFRPLFLHMKGPPDLFRGTLVIISLTSAADLTWAVRNRRHQNTCHLDATHHSGTAGIPT